MTTLLNSLDANAQTTVVSLSEPTGTPGAVATISIDSETMPVISGQGSPELTVDRGGNGTTVAVHAVGATVEYAEGIQAGYDGTHSFQPLAADLTLGPDAGNVGTDPKFLAAIMGNNHGDDLTKEGAYLGGVIGVDSITGPQASEYQKGALLGIVMDGVTEADGAVVAIIDGSDPSSTTRANAAFAARMNNNDSASGVDYGLDLLGPANPNYTSGLPLAIAKALVRSPHEVCFLEGDDVPIDGTTGLNFAGKGSQFTDYTHGELYLNTGTKASPAWKKVTHA